MDKIILDKNLLNDFCKDIDLLIVIEDTVKIFDFDGNLLNVITANTTDDLEHNILTIYNNLMKNGKYRYIKEFNKLLYAIHNYNLKNGIKTQRIEKTPKESFDEGTFYVFNNILGWYVVVNPYTMEWTDLQYIKEKNKACMNYAWEKINIKKYYGDYLQNLWTKSNRRNVTTPLLYIFMPDVLTKEEENNCCKTVKAFRTKEELYNILKEFTKVN